MGLNFMTISNGRSGLGRYVYLPFSLSWLYLHQLIFFPDSVDNTSCFPWRKLHERKLISLLLIYLSIHFYFVLVASCTIILLQSFYHQGSSLLSYYPLVCPFHHSPLPNCRGSNRLKWVEFSENNRPKTKKYTTRSYKILLKSEFTPPLQLGRGEQALSHVFSNYVTDSQLFFEHVQHIQVFLLLHQDNATYLFSLIIPIFSSHQLVLCSLHSFPLV